jgi:membrane protein YqaA with SNARE-associated domain
VTFWVYIFVFIASFLVDVIPFVGPPAWTVMVFFQVKYGVNVWWLLIFGVTGSALGRYFYSVYIKKLSDRFIKKEKNDDLHFIGSKLGSRGWKVQLFVLVYTLIPVPTTPLFTATGVAGIKPLNIMPAFFVGKFISDAVMVLTGDYVAKNITTLANGFLSWQNILSTAIGLAIISLFFFIDWHKLLLEKKLRLSFHIWK